MVELLNADVGRHLECRVELVCGSSAAVQRKSSLRLAATGRSLAAVSTSAPAGTLLLLPQAIMRAFCSGGYAPASACNHKPTLMLTYALILPQWQHRHMDSFPFNTLLRLIDFTMRRVHAVPGRDQRPDGGPAPGGDHFQPGHQPRLRRRRVPDLRAGPGRRGSVAGRRRPPHLRVAVSHAHHLRCAALSACAYWLLLLYVWLQGVSARDSACPGSIDSSQPAVGDAKAVHSLYLCTS